MLLKVENMSCQHCVNAVTTVLRALDPDATVQVDLAKGEVRASGGFRAEAAIAALADDAYPACVVSAEG